ncbi:MAG: PAS domain S-box protein [Candidatus Omnitrophota bacterium]|nr:PAS domain S-box protein [Candidatus Omnitrophota bacterium]
MKIARRINFSFSALTVIIAGIVLFICYMIARDSMEKAIYDHLSDTAQSRTNHIECFLTTQKNCLTQISQSMCIKHFLFASKQDPDYKDKYDVLIERLQQTERTSDFTHEFFVLDANGMIVASSDIGNIGIDQSTNPYFLKARTATYFKDIYFSGTLQKEAMAVSAPITDAKTGKFLGVIVGRIGLDALYAITTDKTGLGKTGEIYLINRYGYMITPSRFLKNTFLKLKINNKNAQECLENLDARPLIQHTPTPFIYTDYRGVRVLGTHASIPLMQWCLLAKIDEKEAFAPLIRLKQLFVIIALFIPIAGWLLGSFVSGTITMPILELQKGTEIIARGDLDYKVGTGAKDEVGQLSKAFDNMTGKLKTTTTSINELSKEIMERRKTEETLRETTSYLENLFNYANAPIIVWGPESRITWFNHACEHLTGYTADEVLGKELQMLLPEESRDKMLDRIAHASSGEYWESVEIPILRKDKDIRMALWNSANIYDKDGTTILATIAQGQDITSRKLSEERVRIYARQQEEAAKFGKIAMSDISIDELMNEAVILISRVLDTTYSKVLEHFPEEKKLFLKAGVGWKKGWVGHLIMPDGIRSHGGFSLLSNKPVISEDIPNEKRFSPPPLLTEHNVASGLTVVIPGKERPYGILGAHTVKKRHFSGDDANFIQSIANMLANAIELKRDITERKKSEEALRETTSYLENLFNYANAPIIVWDPGFRVTRFNHAFEHLTGYTADEVLGKEMQMLLPEESRDEILDRIAKASSGEYWESVEIPILRKPGDIRVTLCNSANIYEKDGTTVIATIAQGQDITERKKAEEKLKTAMKIKSDFTSMVSHELRTPLTAIKESIAIILEGMVGTTTSKQQDLLNTAKRNVDRLARLINEVLDFQKLESGKMRFQIQENDMNKLVKEIQKVMLPLAKEKGLDFVIDLDKDLPGIKFDRDKIVQVLTNIVSNAVKFTEKGGITISTNHDKKDNVILVSVKDTGPGIKKEDMPRLFHRFEQITGITGGKPGGTGLGLALSKELIEKHHGKIWAESEPDKGTTLYFILPVKTKKV